MADQLLTRAARGDEHAFRELTDPHRRELHFHCYRMLGSMHDAEDAVQDTLLAAWRGLNGFEGRASMRSWLYRIATNRCLNALRDAGRRPPPPPQPPFEAPAPTRMGEPTWLEPYPDLWLEGIRDTRPGPEASYESRETVELAFIAALQHLPPRQRAALILRDVLGFHAAEVAEMLESTEDSIKGALKRARATVEHRLCPGANTPPPKPDSPAERELVARFTDAFLADDVDAMVALMTDDAWLTMPPSTLEYQGPSAITPFLRLVANWRTGQPSRLVPSRANGQPAFGCYRMDPHSPIAHATGILVLTLSGPRISALTWFLDTGLVAPFGLPRTLPGEPAEGDEPRRT
jgi:RNA polymerase sigma-70 factor (TIGR02960 family)